jgi:hypothetical protein
MTKLKYEENDDRRFTFFPAKRRPIIIEGVVSQLNRKKDTKNSVFAFAMPLRDPLLHFPAFLGPAYEAVAKEKSLVSAAPLNGFCLEGMTVELYRVEESKKRMALMTNQTLYDFTVDRDEDCPVLRFKVRLPATKEQYALWVDHAGREIFAEFTPAQNALKPADDKQGSLGLGSNGQPEDDDELPDATSAAQD